MLFQFSNFQTILFSKHEFLTHTHNQFSTLQTIQFFFSQTSNSHAHAFFICKFSKQSFFFLQRNFLMHTKFSPIFTPYHLLPVYLSQAILFYFILSFPLPLFPYTNILLNHFTPNTFFDRFFSLRGRRTKNAPGRCLRVLQRQSRIDESHRYPQNEGT